MPVLPSSPGAVQDKSTEVRVVPVLFRLAIAAGVVVSETDVVEKVLLVETVPLDFTR